MHAWPSSTPERERRAGRARRAAVRRLITAHKPEYLDLLEQELVAHGGGQNG